MSPPGAPRPQLTSPLARLATAQHGVVSRRQILALGISPARLKGLVAHGHLIRVHRSVYAVGHARLSIRGVWLAAVLACGEGALLSHDDAAALHGLRRPPSRRAVHVTAGGSHRRPGIDGHVVRDLAVLRGVVVDLVPVTSLERTALDLAASASRQRVRSMLEEIQRRNLFDMRAFEAELARANGHRGVGRLATALDLLGDEPPLLRSGLELTVLEALRDGGVSEPVANASTTGDTVDFRWPRHRVSVEIDSYRYHRSRRSFNEDRRRGNRLALVGDVLLRFTDDQVAADVGGVVAEIAAALRTAGPGVR